MTIKTCDGFTLVELVVTVVMMGVLSAVAVTTINAKAQHSVTLQADKLRRDLSRVQLLAISQNSRLRVLVDAGGTSYSVISCSTPACTTSAAVTDPDTGQNFSVALTDGVTMTPVSNSLDFDSLGRPQSAGSLIAADPARTYTLSTNGRSVTVSVRPITGFASTTY